MRMPVRGTHGRHESSCFVAQHCEGDALVLNERVVKHFRVARLQRKALWMRIDAIYTCKRVDVGMGTGAADG